MLIRTGRDGFHHPGFQRDHARGRSTRSAASCSSGWPAAPPARRWPPGRSARRWRSRCSGPASWRRCPAARSTVAGAVTMEKITEYKDATSYNNFYEFGTDKADPAQNAHTLKTTPWTVEVEGLVKKPGKYALEDLLKLSAAGRAHLPPALRRGLVDGDSLGRLFAGGADQARSSPLGNAKYVEFVTLADPKTDARSVGSRVLDWPYVEGLRLDEAMHPLTLLTFGMYGEVLPNQNGAPLRLVVPWKYGFKSAKSIVKIRFAEQHAARPPGTRRPPTNTASIPT